MKKQNEYINQLYQIKILLLILIILCVLGFYGLSRSMWDEVAVTVTKVCEALLVIGFLVAPVTLIVWIRALRSKTRAKTDAASGDATTEAAAADS